MTRRRRRRRGRSVRVCHSWSRGRRGSPVRSRPRRRTRPMRWRPRGCLPQWRRWRRRRRRLGRVEPAAGSGRRRRRAAPPRRARPSPRGGPVLGGGGAHTCLSLRARGTRGCTAGSRLVPTRRATRPRARCASRGGVGRVEFFPAEKLHLRIAADAVVPVRTGEVRGGGDQAAARETTRQARDTPRRGADEHPGYGGGSRRARRPDRDATGRSIREMRETPDPAEARRRARGRSRIARAHDRPEDAPGGCRRARRRHQSAHALSVEARASECAARRASAVFSGGKQSKQQTTKTVNRVKFRVRD